MRKIRYEKITIPVDHTNNYLEGAAAMSVHSIQNCVKQLNRPLKFCKVNQETKETRKRCVSGV
jgi:hypothetical protein